MVSALEAVAAERWATAVLLSVHAAISATDAACVATAGMRSVSPTHMDQVRLVRQLFPGNEAAAKASNHLSALLDLKNAAEYEARPFARNDAEKAIKHVERLVNWARQVFRGT